MKNTKYLSGILLVAISAIAFGLLPVFVKIAYAAGASTYTLLFLRFLIATVFMFLLFLFKKMQLPSKQEMLAFFLLGAAGYVGQSFCYFAALNYASPSTVSLLFYIYPALVMLGSAIVFKEKITMQKIASLCFALTGAFVIVGLEFNASFSGIVFAILAALLYSVYILISSKVIKPGKGIQASGFIMFAATVVYGAITFFAGFEPPRGSNGVVAAVLIALVCTVLAIWAFFTGMEKTGPSTASLVSTLEPPVTVVASILILSEKITLNLIIGGSLVLLSLLITMFSPKATEDT